MIDPKLLDYQDLISKLPMDSSDEYDLALLISVLGINRGSACESDVNYIEAVRKILKDLGYIGRFRISALKDLDVVQYGP